jgi:NADH:ubiquinone reductase (H+-translocating)
LGAALLDVEISALSATSSRAENRPSAGIVLRSGDRAVSGTGAALLGNRDALVTFGQAGNTGRIGGKGQGPGFQVDGRKPRRLRFVSLRELSLRRGFEQPMSDTSPRVVIVGGGFGGLNAARAFAGTNTRVTLIDRRNHHLFQPLLYQVATAALNPSDIAIPIRRILRHQSNVEVLLAEAKAVDLQSRVVMLDEGSVSYDYLIVATGARHSYFGRDEWSAAAPGLKSIGDALEIRRRVLSAFELAEREPDAERREAWLTFVVVGAGPTGVELSGALCEIAQHALARDFRHINPAQARVILLEGSDRVLPPYTPVLAEKARQQLASLGVDVRTSQKVTGIDSEGVDIGEHRIPTRTVLWAAGVMGSGFGRALGVPLDRAGRVQVTDDLSIPGHSEVFVIGDLACLVQDGAQIPAVAPAATQEAKTAASNVLRSIEGKPRLPFRYRNKGSLATVGRTAAVADLGWIKLSGAPAWLAWLFIHLLFLVGFRNRVIVVFQWMWSFISYDRGARLITGPLHREPDQLRAEKRAVPQRLDSRSLPVAAPETVSSEE